MQEHSTYFGSGGHFKSSDVSWWFAFSLHTAFFLPELQRTLSSWRWLEICVCAITCEPIHWRAALSNSVNLLYAANAHNLLTLAQWDLWKLLQQWRSVYHLNYTFLANTVWPSYWFSASKLPFYSMMYGTVLGSFFSYLSCVASSWNKKVKKKLKNVASHRK